MRWAPSRRSPNIQFCGCWPCHSGARGYLAGWTSWRCFRDLPERWFQNEFLNLGGDALPRVRADQQVGPARNGVQAARRPILHLASVLGFPITPYSRRGGIFLEKSHGLRSGVGAEALQDARFLKRVVKNRSFPSELSEMMAHGA